jgi:hypothetical protein
MKRKSIFAFSLAGFFLMWGIFGFAAAIPRNEPPPVQATLPAGNTPVPGETLLAGIPATGQAEPVLTEIFVFYGLIGLTALFLILAMLSFANKSTAPALRRKVPPSDETEKQ